MAAPTADVTAQARDRFVADIEAQARANGHAPAWLAERRAAAAARFAARGLPSSRDEGWRKTNLQPLARTAFAHGAPVGSVDPAAIARLALPELPGHRLVFVNGVYQAEHSRVGPLDGGARITTLGAAWRDGDAALAAHYGQIAAGADAPFADLNTALAHDGVLVVVPDGVAIEAPIHVVFVGRGGAAPQAHHPRLLVVAGAHSRATIVESYGALQADDVYFTNAVTEIVLAEGAEIDHTKRQLESEAAFHIGALQVRQDGASRFVNHNVALGGRVVRNDVAVRIDARGCDTLLHGLYMGHGEQHIDNHTRLDHAQPGCHSFELYKGVLDGRATAVFTGRIMVHLDAQQTDAVQENRCLLLSGDATIHTQPQLEIFADDVTCTHGASIGELDAVQLNYLRTRGIPPAEAHGILTYAYANEIIERLPVAAVRDELEQLIRSRVRESQRLRD